MIGLAKKEKENLNLIKQVIQEGDYKILQPSQWDKFSADLAGIGANILQKIEACRKNARAFKVPFFFFQVREKLIKLEADYDVVVEDHDQFFDASWRFLSSIIDRNEYKENQMLLKEYVKNLTEHCSKALEYVGNIVTSRRHDYYHYQILFWALTAIFIAVLSVIISVIT